MNMFCLTKSQKSEDVELTIIKKLQKIANIGIL